MAQRNPPNRPVKSVNNVFEIIEYLRETDGATLPEIADHVNLAKSTAHGYLKTLEYRKNIICDDEEYKLSLRFSDWGEYVKNQHPMSGVADDEMEMIAEQTGESVWLFVEECGQAVRLLRVEGDYSVTTWEEWDGAPRCI
jgi:DNA-binding IclR family transcriptional regulator